jgi:hypothetical protein
LAKGRRYSRKRKRYVILLGAMILLLAYPLYQWLSPPSAEEVMYATLRALQVGDVKKLILLTHPEEIRSLNLTPEAVDALLRTGVWRKGYLRPHGKPMQALPRPPDMPVWVVPMAQPPNLNIPVYQANDGRWYLSLSEMTAAANALAYRHDPTVPSYWTVAERFGVVGYYRQNMVTGQRELVRRPGASGTSSSRAAE